MKETVDKLDFTKVKNFCSEKDNVKKMRRLATDREKFFLWKDKELLSEIHKECIKLPSPQKTNILI